MNAIDILIIGSLIATATWTISFLLSRLKNDIIEEMKKELIEEMKKENKKDETN